MSPVIEVDDLVFRYPKSAEPAVRGIGFTVGAGEVFGFLGPSGAGKSTTQKIVIGLPDGYAGQVTLLGDTPGVRGPDLYERVGLSLDRSV
jgi:fluoroquinolone transport system ATP-binding protein